MPSFLDLLLDFLVADRRRRAHCSEQLLLGDLVLQFFFELRDAQAPLALHEILVLRLADELAFREEHLTELPLVEIVDQFAVADTQAPCARLRRRWPPE